jgi:hypothetical protein
VLARLAREGLTPVFITTNFDLLLEGAFRVAGFTERDSDQSQNDFFLQSNIPYYVRIAEATQFFSQGEGYRTAIIAKIHGCVDNYRKLRSDVDRLTAYLKSIVFTYREIQNWRDDSWARDFIATLLRTRTLVFCGYSGMDPVLHDTFRTVYEEMSIRRQNQNAIRPQGTLENDAPAYFLGIINSSAFHGLEILRSSSRAVSDYLPELSDHPNRLPFHLPSKEDNDFPLLDEIMLWIYHRTMRKRQMQALDNNLHGIASGLLEHVCPHNELKAIKENFMELCKNEVKASKCWSMDFNSRNMFKWIVGWTYYFHAALLREFEYAEANQRRSEAEASMQEIPLMPWYSPVYDHPDWAAWLAVVELALRRMVAVLQDRTLSWSENSRWLFVVEDLYPRVCFRENSVEYTKILLTILITGCHHIPLGDKKPGAYKDYPEWKLKPSSLLWKELKPDSAPNAKEIWYWAGGRNLTELKNNTFYFNRLKSFFRGEQ